MFQQTGEIELKILSSAFVQTWFSNSLNKLACISCKFAHESKSVTFNLCSINWKEITNKAIFFFGLNHKVINKLFECSLSFHRLANIIVFNAVHYWARWKAFRCWLNITIYTHASSVFTPSVNALRCLKTTAKTVTDSMMNKLPVNQWAIFIHFESTLMGPMFYVQKHAHNCQHIR